MEVVEKTNDKNITVTNLFKKLFFIALDYFRFGPLIFIFCYVIALILILVVKTDYEIVFVKILMFLFGSSSVSSNSSFPMIQNDFSSAFFKIWFVFGTFFQIIDKLFKIRISNKTAFFTVSLILLVLSIFAGIKFKAFDIFLFLYVSSVINLGMFFLFSKGVGFLDKLLNRI